MKEKKRYRNYLLVYLALFAAVSFCVFFPYLQEGKNLIGKGDGQSQYILQLRYMGEWLRSTLAGFLHGDFHPDRFDFTIGMGDDIGAVVRFHPLDFLSVFVPGDKTEILYSFITILRSFLAGLSLSVYVLHFRRSTLSALSGALVYVFCGFTFGLGIVHPTYLSHMILFPLTMLGAEYMMDPERRHSPALFTTCIALGFISNYYFMYISSFGLLAYVLIRFFAIYKEQRLKNFLRLLSSMSFAYLLGLAISAVFLLPALLRYGSSLRTSSGAERNSLLVYADKRRYAAWFLNMITPLEASGNGTHLNFSVTLFPAAVITVAAQRRKKALRQLRAGLFLLLAGLLVPGVGYVLAAMNNENNRWVYLIAFGAALAVSFTADMVTSMGKKERRFLFLGAAVFDLGCAAWFVMTKEAAYHIAAALQLTVYTVLLLARSRRTEKENTVSCDAADSEAADPEKTHKGSEKVVLLFTAVSVMIAGFLTFSPKFGNLVTYYQKKGTAFSRYEKSAYSVYDAVPEKSEDSASPFENGFYRVDGIRKYSWEDNSSLLLKYPGIQIYNSIVNADELKMMIRQQNIGLTSILHIQSLDGRTIPEELAGVKYFAAESSNAASVPYGYSDEALRTVRKYSLYENRYPLAFGFTAGQVMSRKNFDQLDPAAGDLAFLEAAVVEDARSEEHSKAGENDAADTAAERSAVPETDGKKFAEQVLKTESGFTADSGAKVGDGVIGTGKKKGTLTVSFERKPGYECYLSLEDLALLSGRALGGEVEVLTDGIDKIVHLSAKSSGYTRGADDYLVNLGTEAEDGGEGAGSLQIVIPENMKISLGKIRFFYLPMKDYAEKIGKLNEHTLQNVSFEGDRITGTAELDKPAYMVFQIPYSDGWSAEVNGKKVCPDRADLCYLGISLDAGTSEIILTYRSPGVWAGGWVSLAGLLLFLALWYNNWIRCRKHPARRTGAGKARAQSLQNNNEN